MEVYIPYIVDHLPRLTFFTVGAYHAARILGEVAIVFINELISTILGGPHDSQEK